MADKALQAKCKFLTTEYDDVLRFIQSEIQSDLAREAVSGDTSFEVAKKALRKEGIKEGITMFLQRINKYAAGS